MNRDKELLFRNKGLGFFSAITASLSHEISNVFAIVNELSGLLDDYFQGAEQGAPLDLKKLRETTTRIAGQVKRGQKYVKRLNQFAHTVDDSPIPTAFNETLEAITTLCRRFGMLRRVEIESNIPEASPPIACSAFDLQHIVFRCIDIILGASKQGDVIQIDVELRGNNARLVFTSNSAVESFSEIESEMDFLAVLVSEMQGEIKPTLRTGQPVRLMISLPCSLNNPNGS
ncbi:MAG: HAMP domain-containing histidine kinase [Proteobacteria bacterium]|nr:HAMP domain-containing histidine kinase [Pseudomonadota bacterium]